MSEHKTRRSYAWEEFLSDIYSVVIPKLLPQKHTFNGIWAPAMGGYVPLVILSHNLDLLPLMSPRDKKTLIVDDIADSGESLIHYKEYPIVTFFYFRDSIVTPMLWLHEKKYASEWIDFPWEVPWTPEVTKKP